MSTSTEVTSMEKHNKHTKQALVRIQREAEHKQKHTHTAAALSVSLSLCLSVSVSVLSVSLSSLCFFENSKFFDLPFAFCSV